MKLTGILIEIGTSWKLSFNQEFLSKRNTNYMLTYCIETSFIFSTSELTLGY